jgi:putative pyruvate formate lyase activating enzyme
VNKTPEETIAIGERFLSRLVRCDLCPQECRVDRTQNQLGKCGVGDRLIVASSNLHFGEEPPLSGTSGSGTIFLSGCSLACVYCQNYPISQQVVGSVVTIDKLVSSMLALFKRGAHNINFVTPDHFIGHIVTAIGRARGEGLAIPVILNCSGFQKLDTLRKLDGIIDLYLVDMRYADNEIARNCSQAKMYKEISRDAVREMFRQVGNLKLDGKGIAQRGVLIRHLVLPDDMSGSGEIFRFLAEEISSDIYVSLMSQYFPAYRAAEHQPLHRRITRKEFDRAVELFYNAGLKNGYIQHMEKTPA